MNHTKVVSILAIMASADVAMLNMIWSKIGGFQFLSAPTAGKAEIIVFWGSFINIFIEDVPQFIIRVS